VGVQIIQYMNDYNYNTIPALDPLKVKLEPFVVNVSGLNRTEDEEEEIESVAV
jgi:hypothetical protein